MTDLTKMLKELRSHGYGYTVIAKTADVKKDTLVVFGENRK